MHCRGDWWDQRTSTSEGYFTNRTRRCRFHGVKYTRAEKMKNHNHKEINNEMNEWESESNESLTCRKDDCRWVKQQNLANSNCMNDKSSKIMKKSNKEESEKWLNWIHTRLDIWVLCPFFRDRPFSISVTANSRWNSTRVSITVVGDRRGVLSSFENGFEFENRALLSHAPTQFVFGGSNFGKIT